MPKLNAAPPARPTAGASAPAFAAVRAPDPAPRALWTPHPHAPADHMAFRNADGTVSRVCICTCERCWPTGTSTPGPCPDWNDGSV